MLYHIIVFDYNTVAVIIVMLLMVISVKSMVVHVVCRDKYNFTNMLCHSIRPLSKMLGRYTLTMSSTIIINISLSLLISTL